MELGSLASKGGSLPLPKQGDREGGWGTTHADLETCNTGTAAFSLRCMGGEKEK